MFDPANENNKGVLFDIQYIEGENSQGSYIDQYCGTGTGSWTRGSRYVPTDDLVAAYETIDGSPVDPENPYENRDPRLGFTAVLPVLISWAIVSLITCIREVRLIMPVIG